RGSRPTADVVGMSESDPQRPLAESKSRSAAVSCRCAILSIGDTGDTGNEAVRVHHASWRRGCVAARGARTADGDAHYRRERKPRAPSSSSSLSQRKGISREKGKSVVGSFYRKLVLSVAPTVVACKELVDATPQTPY